MPIRNPNPKIAAITRIAQQQQVNDLTEAEVTSVAIHGKYAQIRIGGSATFERASKPDQLVLRPGDRVIVARPSHSRRWVILTAFTENREGDIPNVVDQQGAIASPADPIGASIEGGMLFTWAIPPSHPNLSFVVEVADDPGTYATTNQYYVRGSVFIDAEFPGLEKSYRVRCVDTNWESSGWTDWVDITAGGVESGTDASKDESPTDGRLYYASDTGTFYVSWGSVWVAVTNGAGGETSSSWDPDVAPSSPSAIDDEFEDDSLDGQWAEFDPGVLLTVAESGTKVRLTAEEQVSDIMGGIWVDTLDTDGPFTIVTKVTMISSHWTLADPITGTNRVRFGIGVSKADHVADAFATAEIRISRAAGQDTIRRAMGTLWDDTSSPTYGEYIYPNTDIPSNDYTWYLRLRKSPTDEQTYYWRADFSLDGLTWNNGVIFRDTDFTACDKLLLYAANRNGDADLVVDFEFFRYRSSFDDPQDPCYGGSTLVLDHGVLTGLSDDDHTQYHNDTRGDARYSQLGHSHTETDITDLDHDAEKLQGRTLASNAPATGQVVAWSGSQWEPSNPILLQSTSNFSNPPTAAELTSAFGSPDDGFVRMIDDNGGGSNFYLVTRTNGAWVIFTGTVAS